MPDSQGRDQWNDSPEGFFNAAGQWVNTNIGGAFNEPESVKQQREAAFQQSAAAGGFAGQGERGYAQMTGESQAARDYLRGVARGDNSLSQEQLRQGLQQNMASQRSMAASASPQNSSMAARTAAMQMGRQGSAMSGQASIAGIQERDAANRALMQAILQQRQQDAQVALGARQNAIQGYTQSPTEKNWMERNGGALAAGGAAMMASDRRLKKDVEDADSEVSRAVKGLRAYTYKYKDEKFGKGKQVGIMAQDLEKAGLKHAVIDTPDGKMVHGAKLAGANTAMIAALGRRIEKLEGKK